MDFVDYTPISLRELSDNYGPFSFDFSNQIPSDTELSSVTINAYQGRFLPGKDPDSRQEVDIIDSNYDPEIENNIVKVLFKYPTNEYTGKATIEFIVTTDANLVYPFYFHGITID